MVLQEWLDQVEEAILTAAKLPTFPGEETKVREYLRKMADKLSSECRNGGELGQDNCLVCRAVRTDRLEETLRGTEQSLVQALAEGAKARGDLQDAQQALRDVRGQLAQSAVHATKLAGALKDAERQQEEAESNEASMASMLGQEREERERLRVAVQDYSAQLRIAQERVKRFEALAQAAGEV